MRTDRLADAARQAVTIGAAITLALILGALGPTLDELDAQPDRRGEWLQAEQQLQQQGMLARWEAEARDRCARHHGPNGAVVRLDDGHILCTDKRGRLARREAP